MTIVRLCVFTYLDVFLVTLGEIVSSDWTDLDHVSFGAKMIVRAQWLYFGAKVVCAPNGLFGGQLYRPEFNHVDLVVANLMSDVPYLD